MDKRPPIVWSIAGHDSGGGAGLSADQRAADAMGVHLCPVVAAITAQNSQGVDAVFAVDAAQLDAQLSALARDMPPVVIKTGLLGSAAAIQIVARWVDHLRATTPTGMDPHRHLALIVDPVLGASAGGVRFTDERVLLAYRDELLPRATLITPNRSEAFRLLGPGSEELGIPALAEALRALGARSVAITGGDDTTDSDQALDWLDTPQARGWLAAPRVATRDHHGTGCTFATGVASAWALGHVEADAVVLAKMLTHHALQHSRAAGQGPGPVIARPGFAWGLAQGGAPLPWLGLGEDLPWRLTPSTPDDAASGFQAFNPPEDGLYGIVADAPAMRAALQAGWRCLQLRHKPKEGLAPNLAASLQACSELKAQLFINDHWREALTSIGGQPHLAPVGLHLGQEDLLAMGAEDLALLCAAKPNIMLGISSHSLWELARAAGIGASYVACGPVQPTTTKDMPWRPQGLDNLAWWTAHSPAPVVAIGGLLTPEDVRRFAQAGPAALCVVRGMGIDGKPDEAAAVLANLSQAVALGRQDRPLTTPVALPHPVL